MNLRAALIGVAVCACGAGGSGGHAAPSGGARAAESPATSAPVSHEPPAAAPAPALCAGLDAFAAARSEDDRGARVCELVARLHALALARPDTCEAFLHDVESLELECVDWQRGAEGDLLDLQLERTRASLAACLGGPCR